MTPPEIPMFTNHDFKKLFGWFGAFILTGVVIWARDVDGRVSDLEKDKSLLATAVADIREINKSNSMLLVQITKLQTAVDSSKETQERIYNRLEGLHP